MVPPLPTYPILTPSKAKNAGLFRFAIVCFCLGFFAFSFAGQGVVQVALQCSAGMVVWLLFSCFLVPLFGRESGVGRRDVLPRIETGLETGDFLDLF